MASRKSKATGIIVAGTVLAILGGCASTTTPTPSDPNFLTISAKEFDKPGIDAVVAAFKEANPEVQVLVTSANTGQYQTTLRTQLSSGTAADVVEVWPANGNVGAMLQLAPGGFLADLSDRSWVDDYKLPLLDSIAKYEGKTYAFVPAVTSFGPWYNDQTLAESGLTPPAQWSDVIPFCKAAAAQGKVAWAVGAGGADIGNGQNFMFGIAPDLVYGANPDFDQQLLDGDTTFASNKGWKTAVSQYQEAIDAGCFTKDASGVSQADMNRQIATGEALGYFGTAYQLAAIQPLNPDATYSLHVVSGDDDPDTNMLMISSASGVAVNAHARNPELAMKFIDFLAQPENDLIFAQALGKAIPTHPALIDQIEDPNQQQILEILNDGRAAHFLDQAWPNPQIQQAEWSGFQGMLAGTTKPEDVLSAMDAAFKP